MDEDLPHNTHALISYNHDAPQEEGGGEYEEVIAEHSDNVIDDNKNEKEALMLVDDYLTEFDDVPREVRFQFLERFTFCAHGCVILISFATVNIPMSVTQ